MLSLPPIAWFWLKVQPLTVSVGQLFFRLVGGHSADDQAVSSDPHEFTELPQLVPATLADLESLSSASAGGGHHRRHGLIYAGVAFERGRMQLDSIAHRGEPRQAVFGIFEGYAADDAVDFIAL